MQNWDRQYRFSAGQAGSTGFEIGQGSRPLHISFSVERADTDSANTAKVSLWNLSPEHLAELNKDDCVVVLKAGYGSVMPLVFTGVVTFASTKLDGSDMLTEIELVDNRIELRDTYVSVGYDGVVNCKTLIQDVADQMGVTVSFSYNAEFKDISNGFSYVGPAANVLTKACDTSGLVWSIVKRFTGRGAEMEDLYQIGCIGLIKAIDNFNMDYDVKFSTYAVPMITGEIKRFLRDDGIIKISRSIKENGYKCFTASQKLKGILNREPTIEELSRETGIATEDIIVTMEAGDCVESIYKTIYQKDGNEVCLIDKLEGKDGGSDSIIDNIMINELVDSLCERDRKLIRMRYYEDMTQTQAARVLGISQVQVSRLEKKILNRMRSQIDIE